MLRNPKFALAAAVLMSGALMWFAQPTGQLIRPADAANYEGQIVRVHGVVRNPWSYGDVHGYVVVLDQMGLEVRSDEPATEGDWVETTGRIWRRSGTLTLEEESRLATRLPTVSTTLATIADQPDAWLGVPVTLLVTMDGDAVEDNVYRLPVGNGPSHHGAAMVHGSLRYDARCACHLFDVASIDPWTP